MSLWFDHATQVAYTCLSTHIHVYLLYAMVWETKIITIPDESFLEWKGTDGFLLCLTKEYHGSVMVSDGNTMTLFD